MRNVLISTAFELYIETLPLEGMSTDHPEFHNLYAKECQLFDLLRQMDWQEGEEYRWEVRCYNIAHGIPNDAPSWEREGWEDDEE